MGIGSTRPCSEHEVVIGHHSLAHLASSFRKMSDGLSLATCTVKLENKKIVSGALLVDKVPNSAASIVVRPLGNAKKPWLDPVVIDLHDVKTITIEGCGECGQDHQYTFRNVRIRSSVSHYKDGRVQLKASWS